MLQVDVLLLGKPTSAKSNISRMFVFVARSVPVADAIIEISKIISISCEKFIVPPSTKKYIF